MTDVRSTHEPVEVLFAGATSGERVTHEPVEILFAGNLAGLRASHLPIELLVNVPPPPSTVRATHEPVEVLFAGAKPNVDTTHLPAEFLVNIPLPATEESISLSLSEQLAFLDAGEVDEAVTLSLIREIAFDETATMEGLRYSLQVLLGDQLDAESRIDLDRSLQVAFDEEVISGQIEESISLSLSLQLQFAQDIENVEESLSLARSETVILEDSLVYEDSVSLSHTLAIDLYDEESVALSLSHTLAVSFSEEVIAGACIIDMRWQTA